MDMLVEDVLFNLRKAGCTLFVGQDGAVHGRMRPGGKLPMDARPLIDQLRLHNEQAVALLAQEVTTTISAFEFDGDVWKSQIDSSAIVLAGPVVYDRNAQTATIIFRKVKRNE